MTRDPLTLMLVGLPALAAVGLAFAWLVRVNRAPDGAERVVALLLFLLVLESVLYESPNNVPVGLFHPQAGGLSFRLFDLLIPLAIAARLVARPPQRTYSVQVLVWGAFLVWLALSGVEGLLAGNSGGLVAFHAKAIIYFGTFLLVAAVPPRRWIESRPLHRVIVAASAMAAVLMVTSQSGVGINLPLPVLPLEGFGALGSDTATIFAALGLGTFLVALCSPEHRLRKVLVALPLLAAPLASGQRAAMIALGVALGCVLLLGPLALRNVHVTPSEVGLGVLAALGVVMLLVTVGAAVQSLHLSLPLAREIQDAFSSRSKQLSGQDRVNQWAQARELIAARPWFGWGLGKQYDFYSPGFFTFMRTDLTHNIALDLLLRTGVVGLLLFLAAAVTSLRDALLAWLREHDSRLAALGLACFAALMGLLVKGMFESLFEKYRLAILIGGLVGISASLAAARLAEAAEAARPAPTRRELGRGVLVR